MNKTAIGWTNYTWNPVTGCTKVSAGCKNCYAERTTHNPLYRRGFPNGFAVTLHPERLEEPLRVKKPVKIFVCSMSDLFHDDVPGDFIDRVFDTMHRANWHAYQLLTKRSECMLDDINSRFQFKRCPAHIWLGVSVEDAERKSRIAHLRDTNATMRFLSIEPLIAPVGSLDLRGIHWVIVGGESGPGFRPMKPEWAIEVRDQSIAAGVPFYFKQWGGLTPSSGGRLLEGREWNEFPTHSKEESHA